VTQPHCWYQTEPCHGRQLRCWCNYYLSAITPHVAQRERQRSTTQGHCKGMWPGIRQALTHHQSTGGSDIYCKERQLRRAKYGGSSTRCAVLPFLMNPSSCRLPHQSSTAVPCAQLSRRPVPGSRSATLRRSQWCPAQTRRGGSSHGCGRCAPHRAPAAGGGRSRVGICNVSSWLYWLLLL
jgi:hypothetical protein